MAPKIEVIPFAVPTAVVSINVLTEEVMVQFLNADTSARKALLNLALDMAKARLLTGEDDSGESAA